MHEKYQVRSMNSRDNLVYYANLNARNVSERTVFTPDINFPEASIYRRNKAIRWISVISSLSGCDVDTKHTCIQIFDRYMTSFFLEANKCVENSKFVSLTAAAATLIGTKIHYSKKSLTVGSFPYFKVHDLVNCERLILEKINYDIDPLQSPASYMKIMLDIWPGCMHRHDEIYREACELVDVFWMTVESLQYNPMTIAVSALSLTFSKLQIDSSDWLRYLPSQCVTQVDATGCRATDRCLESFKACNLKSCTGSAVQGNNRSPTTVTAMMEGNLIMDPIPVPPITPTNVVSVDSEGVNDGATSSGDGISGDDGNSSRGTKDLIFFPIKSNRTPQHDAMKLEWKRPVPIVPNTEPSAGKKRRRRSRTDFSSSSSSLLF